MILFIIIQNIS